MIEPDLKLESLADSLPAADLDEAFAARVLRHASGELAAREVAAGALGRSLRGAVVPLLLLSAGGCRTALTVESVTKAYGGETAP